MEQTTSRGQDSVVRGMCDFGGWVSGGFETVMLLIVAFFVRLIEEEVCSKFFIFVASEIGLDHSIPRETQTAKLGVERKTVSNDHHALQGQERLLTLSIASLSSSVTLMA